MTEPRVIDRSRRMRVSAADLLRETTEQACRTLEAQYPHLIGAERQPMNAGSTIMSPPCARRSPRELEPTEGIEPSHPALRVRRSAAELRRPVASISYTNSVSTTRTRGAAGRP